MKKDQTIERCPKCGRDHNQGAFGEYEEANHDSSTREQEPTRIYCCAPDIRCECGLELQWVVPFFRVTKSGYQLSPKPDDRPFREPK